VTAVGTSVDSLRVRPQPGRASARLWLLLSGWLTLTLLLTAASLLVGTSSLTTSLGWLLSPDAHAAVILWDIRLPRTVGAFVAGALLGLAGAVAQGLFRNPLAEPYLLGTASGAALGVTLSLIAADASIGEIAWIGRLGITGAACLGAGAALLLTITLARGVLQTPGLLLAGVVIAFLLSSLNALLVLSKPEIWRAMQTFLLGSTGFLSWPAVLLLAVAFALCIVPAVWLSRGLDALTLGEDTASSMGLSLPLLRLALLGIVGLATATAVGQVGVVGFVGLVAPHLVRETVAVNHRQLLIGAPLCGGTLLQLADLLSRWIIRPAELPVGAVTACVGGVYLVVLLWRRSRDG
jgi:iron complex transport system permease protein